jgi:hypothetical protein
MAIISYKDNRINRPRVVAPGIARTQEKDLDNLPASLVASKVGPRGGQSGMTPGQTMQAYAGYTSPAFTAAPVAAPVPAFDFNTLLSDALAKIDFGQYSFPSVVSSPSSGSGSSALNAQLDAQTAANKLAYDKATAAAATRAAQEAAARARLGVGAQAGALKGLLTGTGADSYRAGADTLLGLLNTQETEGTKAIGGQYTKAKELLDAQYGRASGLLFGAPAKGETAAITGAYPALTAYLQANAPQAYANTTAAAAPVTQNALAQYMQAQGVGPGVTEQEVTAQNAAAQAGQSNYSGLLDVLRRQETAGQTSRLAEAEQAGTLARTGLEAQNAQAAAGLTQQQQAALGTLLNQISGQRFGVEQGATERKQTLQDALTALLGTGYNVTGEDIAEDVKTNKVPEKAPSTVAEEKATKAEEKANPKNKKGQAVTTDWQKKVFAAQPNFTGTFNEAKKKFPKLYAAYLASQKKK